MRGTFFEQLTSGKNRDIRLAAFFKLIPFCIFSIFMLAFYSSGLLHLFPHAFAVDNQERVYLLYAEGGYYATEYGRIKVLPKFEGASTISISDENLLSYAQNDQITVYDIDQSDPTKGKLAEIERYTTVDKDALFASRQLRNGDEQNGVTYAYDHSFFTYQITRTEDGETSQLYRMPTLDVIWNLLVMAYIPLLTVSIWRAVLYHASALLDQQNKVSD